MTFSLFLPFFRASSKSVLPIENRVSLIYDPQVRTEFLCDGEKKKKSFFPLPSLQSLFLRTLFLYFNVLGHNVIKDLRLVFHVPKNDKDGHLHDSFRRIAVCRFSLFIDCRTLKILLFNLWASFLCSIFPFLSSSCVINRLQRRFFAAAHIPNGLPVRLYDANVVNARDRAFKENLELVCLKLNSQPVDTEPAGHLTTNPRIKD